MFYTNYTLNRTLYKPKMNNNQPIILVINQATAKIISFSRVPQNLAKITKLVKSQIIKHFQTKEIGGI